jgi:uncharacterized protein
MRPLAQCRQTADVAWRGVVSAGDGAMASANERLCAAARDGDSSEIVRLVAAGVDPNVDEGTTPLQWAAYYGQAGAITTLVAVGAHVDRGDSHAFTPLMFAASEGYGPAVAALLDAAADTQCRNIVGNTALHLSSMWGRGDVVRALVEAGADVDVRNGDGKQPVDVVGAPLACLLPLQYRVMLLSAALPCAGVQVQRQGR